MVVAVQLDFRESMIDQYDQMAERLGMLPGSPAQRHELFHWVMKTDDGFRVVDVWESKEAFEEFEQEKLQPMFKEVGIRRSPEVQFFDVYNYFAGRRSKD